MCRRKIDRREHAGDDTATRIRELDARLERSRGRADFRQDRAHASLEYGSGKRRRTCLDGVARADVGGRAVGDLGIHPHRRKTA